MTATGLLVLLLGLQIKHLLADYWWQTEAMVQGKGYYGRLPGLVHAAIHGAATAVVLAALTLLPVWTDPAPGLGLALLLAACETVLHYHIDWFKMRTGRRAGYGPSDRAFWKAIGLDQFAHQLTYLALAAIYVV